MVRAWFLAAIVAAACGNGDGSDGATGSEAAQDSALGQCVLGFWLQDSYACTGACVGSAPNPECAATDCTEFAFIGFLEGGSIVEGLASSSATTRTISSVGPLVRSDYTVTAEGVVKTPPGQLFITQCAGDESKASYATYARASADLAAALNTATQSGTSFRSVSMTK